MFLVNVILQPCNLYKVIVLHDNRLVLAGTFSLDVASHILFSLVGDVSVVVGREVEYDQLSYEGIREAICVQGNPT